MNLGGQACHLLGEVLLDAHEQGGLHFFARLDNLQDSDTPCCKENKDSTYQST